MGQPQQFIVRHHAIRFMELHGVVVIPELQAGCTYFRADGTELLRIPTPILEIESGGTLLRSEILDPRWVFETRKRTDNVTDTQLFVEGNDLLKLLMQIV